MTDEARPDDTAAETADETAVADETDEPTRPMQMSEVFDDEE